MERSHRTQYRLHNGYEGSTALVKRDWTRQHPHGRKRPEETIKAILEESRAAHFVTRRVVAEATNHFFRTRKQREMGFVPADFDSARVVLETHPLAQMLFADRRPRLSMHFQSFDQYLQVSRRLGRNHGTVSSIALTLSLPTDLLADTKDMDPWLRTILFCEAPLGHYGLLGAEEQQQIFAHEMGHALDPHKEASLISPKSRLLRELVAMTGEKLTIKNLRAEGASHETWLNYAEIVLDDELETKGGIAFSRAEQSFLQVNAGEGGLIDREELMDQMATGMQGLSKRILQRLTAVEAIQLLHTCEDFNALEQELPAREAKRVILQSRGDARKDVDEFLRSIGIRFAFPADPKALAKYLSMVINPSLDAFYAFNRHFEFRKRGLKITLPENLAQAALAILLPPAWYFGEEQASELDFPKFWDSETARRLGQLQLIIFCQLIKLATGRSANLAFDAFQGVDVQRIERSDKQVTMSVNW